MSGIHLALLGMNFGPGETTVEYLVIAGGGGVVVLIVLVVVVRVVIAQTTHLLLLHQAPRHLAVGGICRVCVYRNIWNSVHSNGRCWWRYDTLW
jgi:hypothetical protein